MSKRSELLHFVVIHSDPDSISHIDSLKGTHIHAIKKSVIDEQQKNNNDADNAPKMPANTVLVHGTVYDLASGRFTTGITEGYRRQHIGGDFGIASHAKPIQGKMTLNDEAMIVGGKAYYGTYEGKGERFQNHDEFSFLQLVSDENAVSISISTCQNMVDLVAKIKAHLSDGTTSFAAHFTGYLSQSATSRTIRGSNVDGIRYRNLKEAWRGWKVYQGENQPDLGHVISFQGENASHIDGLIIASDIKATAIDRFLVADKNGQNKVNGLHYRLSGDPKKEHEAAAKIQNAYHKHRNRLSFREALTALKQTQTIQR